MKKSFNFTLCFLLAALNSARSQTTVIDFDDGPSGVPLYKFYECGQGVTFYNVACWANTTDSNGQRYAGISPGPNIIVGETTGVNPRSDRPLVAVFDAAVDHVSITATDVGDAGARME